jgi:hypothetical protein
MKSEIQGLEDLSGYFVQQDKVVAIRFRPRPRRVRAEGLVERLIPAAQPQPAARPAAAEQARTDTESPAEENKTPEAVTPEIGMYVQ